MAAMARWATRRCRFSRSAAPERRISRAPARFAPTQLFCASHRARTLNAQYRYLPALLQVQQSEAVRRGEVRWVVVVDDDAFVFVPRLLWILSRLNATAPLYLGDFGSSTEAIAMGIPHFACGGAGSVLSVGALRAMSVHACLTKYHARCMQSDWMVGGCARSHGVMELRELGCGTCDPKRLKEPRYLAGVRQRLRDDRCFFLQQATPFARELPLGTLSGAVVHGLDAATSADFFRAHNATARRGARSTQALTTRLGAAGRTGATPSPTPTGRGRGIRGSRHGSR